MYSEWRAALGQTACTRAKALWRAAREAEGLFFSARTRADRLYQWRRRLRGEPPLPSRVEAVLVVCQGNLCRSPFAAALLARRLPGVEVRSAGLRAAEGHPVDAAAVRVAARWGVSLERHRTRPVRQEDMESADLVLVMQGRHAAEVARRWPRSRPRLRLLGDYLSSPPYTIPDPWGRDEALFEAVFARVSAAVDRVAGLLHEPSR